jgi:hypothetical protein
VKAETAFVIASSSEVIVDRYRSMSRAFRTCPFGPRGRMVEKKQREDDGGKES